MSLLVNTALRSLHISFLSFGNALGLVDVSSGLSCEEKSASNDLILKLSIFEASMSKAFFAFSLDAAFS